MTLEHLGIAIANADDAVALFEQLLGAAPYQTETVEREGVRTIFFGNGGESGRAPKLELLEAITPSSPIAAFLDKRGPGLHHIAFEVDDIEAEMKRVDALGFRLLADTPKPGADGKRIVFLHPKSTAGVLVELCQSVEVEPEQRRVPFEDGHLTAFVSGPVDAPPLVVLHAALGSTAFEMRRLTRHWEGQFRVYALDFMAHGDSDPFPGRTLTFDTFTDNVAALLDTIEVARVHLFGFSMGGSVALHTAHRFPERIERLAVHAFNVQWNETEVETMSGAMAGALANPEGHWATRLATIHGADHWRDLVGRMQAFTEALPGQQFPDDALASITAPTLLSTGDRDRYFPLRHALHLRSLLPNSSLAVLPGADHPIQAVESELFAALVTRHLLDA
ncbi:MAG: methylmalonyl-CoA epimerase [Rhodothermaceae bacterium]|nr:methylmalonyl-CoA epimerase [Rhodothermaceae bacterium]